MKIQLMGIDAAFANMGLAHAEYDTELGDINLLKVRLVKTKKTTNKQVRAASDRLARGQTLYKAMIDAKRDWKPQFTFAEVPSGSQSAQAAMGLGLAVGLLASFSSLTQLVEVSPGEVKKVVQQDTGGRKNPSKDEVIKWAHDLYPDCNWLTRKRKGEICLLNDNEHLADAVAAIHAGIYTPRFQDTLVIAKELTAA